MTAQSKTKTKSFSGKSNMSDYAILTAEQNELYFETYRPKPGQDE